MVIRNFFFHSAWMQMEDFKPIRQQVARWFYDAFILIFAFILFASTGITAEGCSSWLKRRGQMFSFPSPLLVGAPNWVPNIEVMCSSASPRCFWHVSVPLNCKLCCVASRKRQHTAAAVHFKLTNQLNYIKAKVTSFFVEVYFSLFPLPLSFVL